MSTRWTGREHNANHQPPRRCCHSLSRHQVQCSRGEIPGQLGQGPAHVYLRTRTQYPYICLCGPPSTSVPTPDPPFYHLPVVAVFNGVFIINYIRTYLSPFLSLLVFSKQLTLAQTRSLFVSTFPRLSRPARVILTYTNHSAKGTDNFRWRFTKKEEQERRNPN